LQEDWIQCARLASRIAVLIQKLNELDDVALKVGDVKAADLPRFRSQVL
jgi:hypothetical protein